MNMTWEFYQLHQTGQLLIHWLDEIVVLLQWWVIKTMLWFMVVAGYGLFDTMVFVMRIVHGLWSMRMELRNVLIKSVISQWKFHLSIQGTGQSVSSVKLIITINFKVSCVDKVVYQPNLLIFWIKMSISVQTLRLMYQTTLCTKTSISWIKVKKCQIVVPKNSFHCCNSKSFVLN